MLGRLSLFAATCFFLVLLHSCAASKPTKEPAQQQLQLPKAAAEFRAAWVASVANINWPSKRGLTTEEQQREAIQLLDFLQAHHFNAVILQIRPQADALYQSDLEPWSYFLTGTQGKAPEPYYDPLQFWIEAAHDRGLELHAWLNPYRAHSPAGGAVTDSSLVKKKPGLVVNLKDGHWWFDPSKPGTQEHATAVVMDIVKRYDVDGIHFDDYFYPYPSYNGNADFPDSVSWQQYVQHGGKLSRGDWRRNSVNTFIQELYKNIKAEKPYVKFGLSPFGTWRPGYPSIVEGFDQYNQLYADARLWLNEGWIDYFTPQLYWKISSPTVSFPILLGWWANENKMHRHLWPGISVGRDTTAANTTEVLNQIMVTRGMLPDNSGDVHWSIGSLTKDSNLAKAVVEGPYKKQALVPACPWLNATAPELPRVNTKKAGDSLQISWTHTNEQAVFHWVVYYQYGNKWSYTILNRRDRSFVVSLLAGKDTLNRIAVSAVDRTGNESKMELLGY
ncbi:hypothetical protein A3860_26315 [Niastella vici]|uniref:Glycosyl hydrolase-like 10 domain-containing protein n=1 Tax=Niastella vici TaxID=1703345 RepID=A0A1V9FWT1_9BACT|nr:family 10 glycosylhydrolase [Niastella vici]OQP62829.1 hypothetical protein A3860_26315 [Niastella vici]